MIEVVGAVLVALLTAAPAFFSRKRRALSLLQEEVKLHDALTFQPAKDELLFAILMGSRAYAKRYRTAAVQRLIWLMPMVGWLFAFPAIYLISKPKESADFLGLDYTEQEQRLRVAGYVMLAIGLLLYTVFLMVLSFILWDWRQSRQKVKRAAANNAAGATGTAPSVAASDSTNDEEESTEGRS